MRSVIVKSGIAIGSMFVLSACSSATTPPIATAPSYQTFSAAISNSTNATPTPLGGTAIRSNGTTAALDITNTTGTIDHTTGEVSVVDGTYTLTDASGLDAANLLTDGSATLAVTKSAISTSSYDYVVTVSEQYTSGVTSYDSTGFLGVVAGAADIPSAGSATYTGASDATITTAGSTQRLTGGTSTLEADFSAGSAQLTMTGFTTSTPALLDTITATGMGISGNTLSGGTLETLLNSAPVNLTGTNTVSGASANFFGYDATNSIPDEVAGVILLDGDSGIISGAFVAD